MKLIIHADDFGMTKSVDEAIIELCSLGTLSSTSVMSNMPWSAEVTRLLPLKNISLGLHATFTQGTPLSPPTGVPSLIDKNGQFLSYAELIKRVNSSSLPIDEIYTELREQYLLLLNLIGDRLIFIDSHHGIHNKLAIFRKAFILLGKEFNIHAIRTRQFHYLEKFGNQIKIIEPGIFKIYKYGTKKVITNYYYKYAAWRFSKTFNIPGGQLTARKLDSEIVFKKLLKLDIMNQSGKILYIVAHPANSINDLIGTNLKQERLEEYYYLKSDHFRKFVKKNPLINFKDI